MVVAKVTGILIGTAGVQVLRGDIRLELEVVVAQAWQQRPAAQLDAVLNKQTVLVDGRIGEVAQREGFRAKTRWRRQAGAAEVFGALTQVGAFVALGVKTVRQVMVADLLVQLAAEAPFLFFVFRVAEAVAELPAAEALVVGFLANLAVLVAQLPLNAIADGAGQIKLVLEANA